MSLFSSDRGVPPGYVKSSKQLYLYENYFIFEGKKFDYSSVTFISSPMCMGTAFVLDNGDYYDIGTIRSDIIYYFIARCTKARVG